MMAFTDYYRMLGVPKYATQEEIRNAYLGKISGLNQKSKSSAEDLRLLIQKYNAAYAVLSNEKEKRQYDEILDRYLQYVQMEVPVTPKSESKKINFKIAYCVIGIAIAVCAFGVFWEIRPEMQEVIEQNSILSAIAFYFLSILFGTLGFAVEYRISSLIGLILGLLEGVAFTSSKITISKKMQWVSVPFHCLLCSRLFLALFEHSVFPVCWALALWILAPGSGQTLTLMFEKRFYRISPFSYIMTLIFGLIVYAVMYGQILV